MTLKDFLSTLKTKNVNVTIYDRNDDVICKIDASGYAALDDTLENQRPIHRWTINGASALTVVVDDVADVEPDPDPTPDPDPDNNSNSGNNTDPSTDPGTDPSTDPNAP